MLHLLGGGTATRRLPGASQFPWKEIIVAAIVLIVLAAIAYGAKTLYSSLTGGEGTAPVARSFDATQGKPVAQPVQQAPVATVPVIVDYRGVWTAVQGFDPSTIPVEEGFYSGHSSHSLYPNTNRGDLGPVPVRYAYAWKILPHLEGLPVTVSAARDESNKEIVLLAFDADRYGPYILLSVDGKKPFCRLDLLPRERRRDAVATRVVARGEEIHLYGQDPRPGNHWWEQVVKKSELPCS